MGSRCPSPGLVACALVLAPVLLISLVASSAPALDVPGPGAWIRPVDGAVARAFLEPRSRYGAGHRGVDFTVAPGAAVRAANAGVVSFAGTVAGSLHVVVAHPGGLRTSASFLATVAVRRGQQVARGEVLGTAGAGAGEHAGVLHFGLRLGDRYVDPMQLFVPADLTRLIRLVPLGEPAQAGFDPPTLEQRSLAESLHLPRGITPAEEEPSDPLDALGDALTDVVTVARALTAPVGVAVERLGTGASWLWHRSLAAPITADGAEIARRLVAWAASRRDCVDDPTAAPGGGGSGHLAVTVAGINSRTDPATGTALPLDAERLGYRAGEVRSFSYADDGGPYAREDTTRGLGRAAVALGEQLRVIQREQPGREVDLIAHSQGGVVAVEFLTHVYDASDPAYPPLGTVVTLSSPLQGAPAATAVARARTSITGAAVLDAVDDASGGALPPTSGRSTRDLVEGSALVRGLRASALPEQIELTSIGGVDDIIVPADRTSVPGATSLTINPAGLSDHTSIVTDRAALDATRLALEGRPLPCVGIATGVRGAVEPVVISRAERTIGDAAGVAGRASDALLGLGGRR